MTMIAADSHMDLHQAINYSFAHLEAHFKGKKIAVPYISGKPGGGKSEMMAYECKKRGYGFLPVTVGLVRVERFTGIPDFKIKPMRVWDENGYPTDRMEDTLNTEWSVPELVVKMRELAEKHERVIVLYDDWHIAPPEVQASGFETFTYWSINGYKIPRNVGFVLAGNPSAAAGARNSFSAVMNRVCKIGVDTNFEYWRDNYAYPHNLHPEIISFLDNKANQHLFHGEENTKDPWSSPRSWSEFAVAMESMVDAGIDLDSDDGSTLLHQIGLAHIGGKAGTEFQIYHTIYSKINAKEIFNTGRWKFPSDPIERFAFGAACTAEFYDRFMKEDPVAIKVFGEILMELEDNASEIVIRSIRYLASKNFKLPQLLIRGGAISQKTLTRLLDVSKALQ